MIFRVQVLRGAALGAILLCGGLAALPAALAAPLDSAQGGAPGDGTPEDVAPAPLLGTWVESGPANLETSGAFPASPENAPRRRARALPGLGLLVPSAWGHAHGEGVGWGALQAARNGGSADGAIGVVVGMGDRRKIAAEVGLNILSLTSTNGGRSGFAGRGSLNAKVDHSFPGLWAAAVGVQNFLNWGGSDAPINLYGCASKMIPLQGDRHGNFRRLFLTGGIQTLSSGSWQGDMLNVSEGFLARGGHTNLFGCVTLNVTPPLNTFVEWTGQNLDIGASWVPSSTSPLILTLGLIDLAGSAEGQTRFVLGLGAPFTF